MAGIIISTNEAAATLLAGVDAFRNERKSSSSRPRVIVGFTIVGGNAINEAEIDIYAADHFFGTFRNTRAGVTAALMPDDFQAVSATVVAPGDRLVGLVRAAPTVSPLLIGVYGQQR